MREEEGEGRRARQGEEVKEGQGGGRGKIIMSTCPEFTKRTEHLLRLIIERQHW